MILCVCMCVCALHKSLSQIISVFLKVSRLGIQGALHPGMDTAGAGVAAAGARVVAAGSSFTGAAPHGIAQTFGDALVEHGTLSNGASDQKLHYTKPFVRHQ